MFIKVLVFLSLISFMTTSVNAYTPEEGKELIGQKAPEFSGLTWINTEPLTIKELRGKVVLIRFWLVGCPYCRNTAPALVELHERYKDEGLVVIGIHHPKSERTKDPEVAVKQADVFGFNFPVAHDKNWNTINRFWLNSGNKSFTSSSVLIDREGIIRFVHDGGEYYRSESDEKAQDAFDTMNNRIVELLDE